MSWHDVIRWFIGTKPVRRRGMRATVSHEILTSDSCDSDLEDDLESSSGRNEEGDGEVPSDHDLRLSLSPTADNPYAYPLVAESIKLLDDSEFCRLMRMRIMREFPKRWVTLEMHRTAALFTSDRILVEATPYVATWIELVREHVKHLAIITFDARIVPRIVSEILIEFDRLGNTVLTFDDPLGGKLSTADCVFSTAVYIYCKRLSEQDKHSIHADLTSKGFVTHIRDESYYEALGRSTRKDVMISYSHHDGKFARHLKNAISKYGVSVWLDETSIVPGQYILDEVERATQECLFVVVILSRSFLMNERWCRFEFRNIMTRQ